MPWLDPIGTLFFVAACTERMQLGGTVLILGYRPPMLTAKAMASLDVLSGGRAILGVGVGWMKEEFDVLGMPYDHRGKRADEQLALFEQVFTEASPSFHGEYYDVPEIGFEPKPVNGHIPVWVGGDTEPAFRRVVRSGDAFHAAFQTVSDVDAAWRRIGELLDEAGRDRSSVRLSVRLYLDPGEQMTASKSIGGSNAQMLDTVGAWSAIGVDHILLDPVAPGGVAGRRAAMEAFRRRGLRAACTCCIASACELGLSARACSTLWRAVSAARGTGIAIRVRAATCKSVGSYSLLVRRTSSAAGVGVERALRHAAGDPARYADHVADRYDLRPDMPVPTRVHRAQQCGRRESRWIADDRRPGRHGLAAVLRHGRRHAVAAAAARPSPGFEHVRRRQRTTRRQWPHEGVDFTGQRVARHRHGLVR